MGDRLAKVEPLIDWEDFRPIISPIYNNRSPEGAVRMGKRWGW